MSVLISGLLTMDDGRQLTNRAVATGHGAGEGYRGEKQHQLFCRKRSLPDFVFVVQLAELYTLKYASLNTEDQELDVSLTAQCSGLSKSMPHIWHQGDLPPHHALFVTSCL